MATPTLGWTSRFAVPNSFACISFCQSFTAASQLRPLRSWGVLALLAAAGLARAAAQEAALATAPARTGPVVLTIKAGEAAGKTSPIFYGLMTEEINYSYDGGLYAELVNNRTFKDRRDPLRYWKLAQPEGASNSMSVVTDQPLNEFLTNSLKLEAASATPAAPVGIANEGFWGIPVTPNTRYRASFYAQSGEGFTGPLTDRLVSTDGATSSPRRLPESPRTGRNTRSP